MLVIPTDYSRFSMEPHHGQFSTRMCSLVVLAIVCCIDSVSRIHGSIVTSPQNRIVTVGEDVTFVCSSDITNKTTTWIYKPPYKLMSASTFPLTISNGTAKRPPFLDKVEIQTHMDSSGTNPVVFYNLIVKNVQFGDAGLYTCQDNNGYGQPVRGALLAVVDGPTCSLDRDVTTSSDHPTVNCTVSYCGNFTFIVNWANITLTESLPTMSTGQSQPPQYQNISKSDSSRTESIVNSFTTTIYTQTWLATVTNSSLNYTCNFNVTPNKPQIISDTIDNTVPTTSTITPFLVNISLSVNETGCSVQTSDNIPVNDGSTISINIPIRIYTSNYPPPSYQWVVCYNASNCTTSTNEELLFSEPGIISSLNCTVTNRIEDRSYTCNNALKNINVKSSNDHKADVPAMPSQALGQTGSAKLASVVAPAVIVPVIVIIGVIGLVWFFYYRHKGCPIFSNRGGTCFNGKSCDASAQQGQPNLANNCGQQNGKKIDTDCSELKVPNQNGVENAAFSTTDQNIKPEHGSQKNLSTNGLQDGTISTS